MDDLERNAPLLWDSASTWIQYLQSKCLIDQSYSVWSKVLEEALFWNLWLSKMIERCFCNSLCTGVLDLCGKILVAGELQARSV